MKSGYPSRIEERFYSSLEGSYFKREMTKARDEKRIGLPLPYDPSMRGDRRTARCEDICHFAFCSKLRTIRYTKGGARHG